VHRYLPQYTLVDSARGEDLAGICAIQVRERSLEGSVLMITIVAPPNVDVVPSVVTKTNDRSSAVDVIVDSYGWRVEIGATGELGEQPAADQIVDLAIDSRLVW
jgi:hypothetical protein